jgi:hypothetical protein
MPKTRLSITGKNSINERQPANPTSGHRNSFPRSTQPKTEPRPHPSSGETLIYIRVWDIRNVDTRSSGVRHVPASITETKQRGVLQGNHSKRHPISENSGWRQHLWGWQIYSNEARTPHPYLSESLRIINGLFEHKRFTSCSVLSSGMMHWMSELLPSVCSYSHSHNTIT